MPTYKIAGKTIRTAENLTDAQIEQIAQELQPATPPVQQPSGVDPDVPTPENIQRDLSRQPPELLTRQYLGPAETAVETIPMIAGGVGAMYGGPVGAAALGGGGEVLRQMITGESDLGQVGQAALTEGVLTKGGDVVGSLLSPFLRVPEGVAGIGRTRTAQETLEQGGGTLSGVQAGQGGVMGVLERMARGSIFGAGAFDELADRNLTSLTGQIDDLVTARTGGEVSLENTARAITDTIEQGYDALKTGYDSVTTQIWNQVPGTLNGSAVKSSIDDVLANHTKSVSGDASAIGSTYSRAVSILQKLPDNPSAREVNENLQLLRGLERGMSKEMGSNTVELQRLGELIDAAESGFATQLKAVDEDLYKAFQDVQAKYGRYKSELFPDLLTPIMRSAKKDAFQSIGQSLAKQSTSLDEIKAVKTALERAAKLNKSLDVDSALATLQESYIRGLFGNPESLKDIAGLAERLSGRGGKAQLETMQELLGPATTKRVQDIADAARQATRGQEGSGVLQLSLGSRQVGAFETLAGGTAATQIFTGDPTTALYAASILLAPAFIAKVATSPTMTKRVINILSSKRPFPARAGEQILTRMVFELGLDPEDFEGTQVDINNLRGRLRAAEERKSGQMARGQ